MGPGRRGRHAVDFARTLTAGGCCHGDVALVEGANSLRGFYHLVELGVPFPHNERGGFVGYKTDHDPRQRATSAGPKTSPLHGAEAARRAGALRPERLRPPLRAGRHLRRRGRGARRLRAALRGPRPAGRARRRAGALQLPERGGGRRRAGRTLRDIRLPPRADGSDAPLLEAGARRAQPDRVAVRPGLAEVPLERLRHLQAGHPAVLQHGRRGATSASSSPRTSTRWAGWPRTSS